MSLKHSGDVDINYLSKLTFSASNTSSALVDLNFSAIIFVASSVINASYCCTMVANKSMANKSTSSVDVVVARTENTTKHLSQIFVYIYTRLNKQAGLGPLSQMPIHLTRCVCHINKSNDYDYCKRHYDAFGTNLYDCRLILVQQMAIGERRHKAESKYANGNEWTNKMGKKYGVNKTKEK